jgi:uncharacterized protein
VWPEAAVRNGKEAVELAQRASRLPGGENAATLEALAAAYAETGEFSEAVNTIQRAVALAESNPALAEMLAAQLKSYLARTPLREKNPLPGN